MRSRVRATVSSSEMSWENEMLRLHEMACMRDFGGRVDARSNMAYQPQGDDQGGELLLAILLHGLILFFLCVFGL